MTDSDSVNPFEAPKQPTISSDPTIGDPIRYEATPTIDDLNSALRPTLAIVSTSILLFLILFSFIAVLLSNLTKGPGLGGELPALVIIFVSGSLVALHLRTKVYAVHNHLHLNPNATAPVTGELTSQGLRLESENRISWSSHDGLVSCIVKNNQLAICHDPQGVVARILPKRGFSNPDRAIRYLEFQASQVSESNLLKPLGGPSMVGDQPTNAIAFGGVVTAGDLKTSPLETIRKRNVIRLLIWLLVLVAVIVPAVGLAFNTFAMLIAALAIFLVCFLNFRRIQSASNSKDPEAPLIAIQGWLSEGEIALLHSIGQSRSGWKDFRSVDLNEACIWLHTYGGTGRFVLLPRRLFANDAQWQAAVEIAASHSSK